MHPTPFKIRRARWRDGDATRQMLVETWHDSYDGIMGADKVSRLMDSHNSLLVTRLQCASGAAWLAVVDGEIAGMASAGVRLGGEALLSMLYVHPRHQGRGIGKALLATVLAATIAPTIDVEVLPGNTRAIAFYEREGFETSGMSWDAAQTGEPAIVMTRQLPQRRRSWFGPLVASLLRA